MIFANLGAAIAFLPWISGPGRGLQFPDQRDPQLPVSVHRRPHPLQPRALLDRLSLRLLPPGRDSRHRGADPARGRGRDRRRGPARVSRGVERSLPGERRPRRLSLVAAIARRGAGWGGAVQSRLNQPLRDRQPGGGLAGLRAAVGGAALRGPTAPAIASDGAGRGRTRLGWGENARCPVPTARLRVRRLATFSTTPIHRARWSSPTANPGPLSPIRRRIRGGYRKFRSASRPRPAGDPSPRLSRCRPPPRWPPGRWRPRRRPIYFITPYIYPNLVSKLRKLGIPAGSYDGMVSR